MKKKKVIIGLIVIILIVFGILVYLINSKTENKVDNTENISKNINENYSDIIVTDFETAKESINDVKEELKINSVNDEFIDGSMNQLSTSINSYKLKQMYKGIEVYNSGLTVYTDKSGCVKGVINEYVDSLDINTTPKSSNEELKKVILSEINCEEKDITSEKLVIYPVNNNYILAHEYTINSGIIPRKIIINDENQNIIDEIEQIQYFDDAYMKQFFKMFTYVMKDDVRRISIYQSDNSELTESKLENMRLHSFEQTEGNEHIINAMENFQKCYDYYKMNFNFESTDGLGREDIRIITGIKTKNQEDISENAAFIEPSIFILGDKNLFNNQIDVLGHEYTHAVYRKLVGYTTENNKEGAALSEAYADIIGMCIEAKYNNGKIDGIMCEDISEHARDIRNSTVTYSEFIGTWWDKVVNYFFPSSKEHYYGMIIGRAAYLMSQSLTAEEFENLWFDSMNLLGYNPSFSDCEYAILATARIMNLSEEKQASIKKAFTDVGLTSSEIVDSYIDKVESELDKFAHKMINDELEGVYSFAVKNKTSVVALKRNGEELKLLDIPNTEYECMDYSYNTLYFQKGKEFYKIDLGKGNGNYSIEKIYDVSSDTEWYNKSMSVYDGKLYYNKGNKQIVELDLITKQEKVVKYGNQIDFRLDKKTGNIYYTLKSGEFGIFGAYNTKTGEDKTIYKENDGITYYLGCLTKNGVIYNRTYLSEVTGYEYNFTTGTEIRIDYDMTVTNIYDYDTSKLYYSRSIYKELLDTNLLKVYDENLPSRRDNIYNAKEEHINSIYTLKNNKLQVVTSGGQDISTYYEKTYLIDKTTLEATETNTTYNIMAYIEDGSDTNTPKTDTSNTTQNSVTNDILVGKWKATNTNSAEYSLGYLFGSSISMNNVLEFKQDGTYILGIGFSYNETGNYEIQGDTIKLTNIKYEGDSPDATPRSNAEFKIKQENGANKIILEHKQDEYISGKGMETLTIEITFEKNN